MRPVRSEIPVATPVAIAATATATAAVGIVVSPLAIAAAAATTTTTTTAATAATAALLIAATASARGLVAILEAAGEAPAEPGPRRALAATADVARLGAALPLGILLAWPCPLAWIAARRRRRPRSTVHTPRGAVTPGLADAVTPGLADAVTPGLADAFASTLAAAFTHAGLAPSGLALARFLHAQRPALYLEAVERGHGGLGFLGRGHLHEPEAAGTSRLSIDDDRYVPHLPSALFEHGPQGLLIRRVGEVANVELGTHRKVSVLVCQLRVFVTSASCA
jgi:hypothetical protein